MIMKKKVIGKSKWKTRLKIQGNTEIFSMYRLPITELKANYTLTVINRAIRVWQLAYKRDDIPDKIDKLQERLERASKKEFIAIYEEYGRRL